MGGKPSKILTDLWLGPLVGEDDDFFVQQGITHVLSLGPKVKSNMCFEGTKHVEANDVPMQNLSQFFMECSLFIHDARVNAENAVVYVHCQAGVSRSSTIVVQYLMSVLGLPRDAVLEYVRAKRECVCPNAGFLQQLSDFENNNIDYCSPASILAHMREHATTASSAGLSDHETVIARDMKDYTAWKATYDADKHRKSLTPRQLLIRQWRESVQNKHKQKKKIASESKRSQSSLATDGGNSTDTVNVPCSDVDCSSSPPPFDPMSSSTLATEEEEKKKD
jgi:hypothetical protein